MLVRIGSGLWGPGGEVAVCAGAGPGPRARPEVEMQDGDVVSCGVGLIFNVIGAARDTGWSEAVTASSAGGVKDGGPPG